MQHLDNNQSSNPNSSSGGWKLIILSGEQADLVAGYHITYPFLAYCPSWGFASVGNTREEAAAAAIKIIRETKDELCRYFHGSRNHGVVSYHWPAPDVYIASRN